MSQKQPYFFVSYAHKDIEIVTNIVNRLKQEGINLWIDFDDLEPGSNWEPLISKAVRGAAGLIYFLSNVSVESKSARNFFSAALNRNTSIFPVLLEDIPHENFPLLLRMFQYFDMRTPVNREASIWKLATTIKQATEKTTGSSGLRDKEIKEVVRTATDEARGNRSAHPPSAPPDSIFIVHGHDTSLRTEVETYLKTIGVKPIVLSKKPNSQRFLFEKFFNWAGDTRFAIVLMSSDDFGASLEQYDSPDVGEKALQFRARQNVILELGFFYGLLGWENVFILVKKSGRVFPNFERPSDVDGVLFDELDSTGKWKNNLKRRLKQAGFVIP